MKLSAASKEIWVNIDNKELFPVDINGGTYVSCSYSLTVSGNSYLLGMINNCASLSLLIFIEQEYEIIVSQRYQSNQWDGKLWTDSIPTRTLILHRITFYHYFKWSML